MKKTKKKSINNKDNFRYFSSPDEQQTTYLDDLLNDKLFSCMLYDSISNKLNVIL